MYRIETYLHSDSHTQNKGGAMIRVTAQTDFATRTEEFIAFCKKAAQFVYVAGRTNWAQVIDFSPSIEEHRLSLEKNLKEKVRVKDMTIFFPDGSVAHNGMLETGV